MGRGTRRHSRPWLFETAESRDASPLALGLNLVMLMWRELVFLLSTATRDSGDSNIDKKSCLQQSRSRNVERRASRVRSGSPTWTSLVLLAATSAIRAGLAESTKTRLALLAATSAIHASVAESTTRLPELPSLKCIWMELPHVLQFAILLGMMVLLYAVNRVFDRLNEASYTRLSRAISGLAKVRKQAANRRTRRRLR